MTTIAAYDRHADSYALDWYPDARLSPELRARRVSFTAAIPPAGTVVNVGCGPGRDLRHFATLGLRVVGVDLSARMAAEARRRVLAEGRAVLVVRADMARLPLGDAAADGVWACASRPHLPKQAAGAALGELDAALAEAGWACASSAAGCDRHGRAWLWRLARAGSMPRRPRPATPPPTAVGELDWPFLVARPGHRRRLPTLPDRGAV